MTDNRLNYAMLTIGAFWQYAYSTPHVCQAIQFDSDASQYMHNIWVFLDACSSAALNKYLLPRRQYTTHDQQMAACWATMAFLHIIVGVVTPALLLFYLEHRSRQFFLSHSANTRSNGQSSGRPPRLPADVSAAAVAEALNNVDHDLDSNDMWVLAAWLVMACAVLWEVLACVAEKHAWLLQYPFKTMR
eukprot:jgi/Chrzof1/5852/Cz16g18050.t1